MGDSDDYGNVSRNLRGCFGATVGLFLLTVAVVAGVLLG